MGEAQGRRAMIKSNTERIRSDVTQAVRAESTPCGMQSRQQKNYPCRRKSFCFPQSSSLIPTPASVCFATSNALLSRQAYYIYIPACSLCVCVCACGERATKPDGCLVWFRLEPSVISAAEVVSCHALATLPNHPKHLNSTLIGLSLQLVCPDSGGKWQVSAIIVRHLASHRLSYFCSYIFSIAINCIVLH